MSLEQISVETKEQYVDLPEIDDNKKLLYSDVNDIVDKTNLAITQVNTNTEDIETNSNAIDNLEENQYSGVLTYSTYAELPTTGTLLVSYKVTNDTDSLIGYYHWNGSIYVKDAEASYPDKLYDENDDTVAQGVDSGFQFGTAQYGYRDIVGIATGYNAIALEFPSTTDGYFYVEYIASVSNLTVAKFASSIRVVSGAIVYQTTKCIQLIETAASSTYYMNIDNWSITSDVCSQVMKCSGTTNMLVYARVYGTANVTSQTLSEVNFGTAYTHSDTVECPRQSTTEGRYCARVDGSTGTINYTDGDITASLDATGTYTVTVNTGTVKTATASLIGVSGSASCTISNNVITVYTRDTSFALTAKDFSVDYKIE